MGLLFAITVVLRIISNFCPEVAVSYNLTEVFKSVPNILQSQIFLQSQILLLVTLHCFKLIVVGRLCQQKAKNMKTRVDSLLRLIVAPRSTRRMCRSLKVCVVGIVRLTASSFSCLEFKGSWN